MPEGDTVWQTARRLHTALAGKVLTHSDLRVPKYALTDLSGRAVLDVTPRGKHLLTRVDGGLTLHSHLRMDGAWKVFAPDQRWSGGPAYQIRAILGTADRTAVGYRLPVLELLHTADEDQVVGHLGPDLLGPDWNPEQALANLLADPARPLGEALLDQRNLAGIGNVYKCELCFLLGATPGSPSARSPPTARPSCPRSPSGSWRPTGTAPSATPPAAAAPKSSPTAGPAAPACAAAPPSGSPTRATAPATARRTGARTARPARLPPGTPRAAPRSRPAPAPAPVVDGCRTL